MSVTDDLVANNEQYAATFDKAGLPRPPRTGVAVLACMDARLNVFGMLGLQEGDCHIVRNAGGVATDDAIRSLAISQRLLGTTEILVIHHTNCGMLDFADDELKRQIRQEMGVQPGSEPRDVDEQLRQSLARLRQSTLLPHRDGVRGFVYQVENGRLREVV